MARPERNNVDYFPFYCEDGNKMFYIEETYGNDGFATFIKLLRELAKTNYHYLDLSKPTTVMFLSAKCKVTKETLLSIVKDLVELGKFDSVLWNENSIVWCGDFIESIQDAYKKRNNECITYEGLLLLLVSLGIRKPSKEQSTVTIKSQSKGKETKENKSKGNNNKDFVPPIELEVIEYFKEKGYSEQSAKKAFDYYNIANWSDSKGNKIKNWKQKMISVWFKPENEIKSNNNGSSTKWLSPA